jgi:hypothetical protein
MGDGWLFKVNISRNDPGTTRFVEWYAAWISDQTVALGAVQALRDNIQDPMPHVDRPYSKRELEAHGVEKGKAKLIEVFR